MSQGARTPRRIGVMGGTFDPIHIAHLVTAEEALAQFALDQVLFMPAGDPPHKGRGLAPAEFRYLLVSVATASHPRFSVSRFEIDREAGLVTAAAGVSLDHLLRVFGGVGDDVQHAFRQSGLNLRDTFLHGIDHAQRILAVAHDHDPRHDIAAAVLVRYSAPDVRAELDMADVRRQIEEQMAADEAARGDAPQQ